MWLPESGVLHAGFVGYVGRHPDIRPDYSLQGQGPQIVRLAEQRIECTLVQVQEEGRRLANSCTA